MCTTNYRKDTEKFNSALIIYLFFFFFSYLTSLQFYQSCKIYVYRIQRNMQKDYQSFLTNLVVSLRRLSTTIPASLPPEIKLIRKSLMIRLFSGWNFLSSRQAAHSYRSFLKTVVTFQLMKIAAVQMQIIITFSSLINHILFHRFQDSFKF